MLLYLIDCTNEIQAEKIAVDLFSEGLIVKASFFKDIMTKDLTEDGNIKSSQKCILFVFSKALLYQKILDKINSYPGTFLIGMPVSAVDWNIVTPLLEKTCKV